MRSDNGNNGNNICICGKVCKNQKGLRIHQGKKGCQPTPNQEQRTGNLGETEEEVVQESNHSDHIVHVTEEEKGSSFDDTQETVGKLEKANRRAKVKWPSAAEKEVWQQFDSNLDNILEATLAGSVDRKMIAMTTIIYNLGCNSFGIYEEKPRGSNPPRENRSEGKIKAMRRDLRNLTKQYKKASEEEKAALEEMRTVVRNKLKISRRAERSRKRRKDRARARARFTSNPFQFTSKPLGKKSSGKLEKSLEEIEEHLKKTHSDPIRNEDLGECGKLITPEPPSELFNDKEPTLKEVNDVIKKARTASSPGPNGIPYSVYKNCPKLSRRLWKMLKVIWRRGKLADAWHFAEGCFIPKEEGSKEWCQFRTISLLNVEGKMFLAVLAKRMTTYLLNNKYIDIAVQKGGIPGISGCLEHTSVISEIIREARENKAELAVVWLDLANAYGSMPHKLVELTLEKYHIPGKFCELLKGYFDRMQLRFTVNGQEKKWQRLEVGIVTGCTISVTLFATAMNMLVKSVERKSRGPYMTSGIRQPPTRAFMDDMTLTTKTVIEGRWLLHDLETMVHWARMKFKPGKSRSMVLKKGKVQQVKFKIQGEEIPTVTEKPIKCLRKWYDDTLKDHDNVKNLKLQAENWMTTVDKSKLPGKYKSWIYQHGILPRLLWPLLIYEVPLTAVEETEAMVSRYLRRWLGVPRSFSNIGLYGKGTKLQLPLSSITEEFKVTKVRQQLMLRDSADEYVTRAKVKVRTGRKWKAKEAIEQAESRLRQSEIVGAVTSGRQGLGIVRTPIWTKAIGKERRDLVQDEIRMMEEESRQTRAVAMRKQGSWMNWEGAMKRKLTWNNIWSMEIARTSFLLRAVYDVLPSPVNLKIWGLTDDPSCKLCGKPSNLEHVLSACQVALKDGRYTWRHDRVLSTIADTLERERKKKRVVTKGLRFVNFIKKGQQGRGSSEARGIFASACDWQMVVDLKGRPTFPTEIANTNQRPDIVIWSRTTKQTVILELTVPWEDRIEEAYERKRSKYQDLMDACQKNGWRTWCMPVEVGCRGFAGQSLWRAMSTLGVIGRERRQLCDRAGKEAETASLWIWWRREDDWKKNDNQ